MKIHVLASIGNVQASPHSPNPSNPAEINENLIESIKIDQNTCPGINWQCAGPPHPPYFSKPSATVPNAMYDGNQYAKKEVGGRGGAYKFPIAYRLLPATYAIQLNWARRQSYAIAYRYQLHIAYCQLPIASCLLPSTHCPPTIAYCLHRRSHDACTLLLIACCLSLIDYCPLPVAITYCPSCVWTI